MSEQGNYVVEYRGVDRGGNAEDDQAVTFTIFRPTVGRRRGQGDRAEHRSRSSVHSPDRLGPFIPGVTQTYTGTATATVTSSWANAQLQVYDPTPPTTAGWSTARP